MNDRQLLVDVFWRAIEAVDPERAVERSLRTIDPGTGPFLVLGAGKAACAMARGARNVLGDRISGGKLTTKDAHGVSVPGLRVIEAAHPIPDARSVDAARCALRAAEALGARDQLLVLISGGASSLWTSPVAGVELADLCQLAERLLASAVPIDRLNVVRKHLSQIKGGGLARAARPARVLTLAVSDVAGDPPDAIGSGPTAPDQSTYADALQVLAQVGIAAETPQSVLRHLEGGARGEYPETPKPGDAVFADCEYRVVAGLGDAIAAATASAREAGCKVQLLGEALYGEVRDVARELAAQTRLVSQAGGGLLVAGGEPTVHVRGPGRGGRAQELALALAVELGDLSGVVALVAGTDGTDGPTAAAGGFVDAKTLERAAELGLDPASYLEANDSHAFLERTASLFTTGPTGTNVTDLALIRVRTR